MGLSPPVAPYLHLRRRMSRSRLDDDPQPPTTPCEGSKDAFPATSRPASACPGACGWLFALVRAAGSMQLAVALLMFLVVVLAWGTYLETSGGAAVARFGIYGTWWFTTLGALLGINIFSALIIRFPWSRRLTGFVVVHLGLLVLLLGCLVSRRSASRRPSPWPRGRAAPGRTRNRSTSS